MFGDSPAAKQGRDDLRVAVKASMRNGRLDGSGLARRISSPQHVAASDYVTQFGALLDQIARLNLTSEAAAAVRAGVLAEALEQLGVPGFSAAQLEASTGRHSPGLRL